MIGAAQMAEMLIAERGDGMADRTEIVDDGKPAGPQPLLDEIGPGDPRVVGQLEDLAADRPGKGDRELVGKVDPSAAAEFLPGELEARMVGGPERHRLTQRGDSAVRDLRQ